jgi:hypothetical protein
VRVSLDGSNARLVGYYVDEKIAVCSVKGKKNIKHALKVGRGSMDSRYCRGPDLVDQVAKQARCLFMVETRVNQDRRRE